MSIGKLRQLARAYGVQPAYLDVDGRRKAVRPEALMGVLRALGAPIEAIADAPAALRERLQSRWREMLAPVIVCRGKVEAELRVPLNLAEQRFRAELKLEDGDTRRIDDSVDALPTVSSSRVEHVDYVAKYLTMPGPLSVGYHRLTIEMRGQVADSLVIRRPGRVFNPWTGARRRSWGVFLPLYAIHSDRSWGIGDLTDLACLIEWTAEQGGQVAATLPLLASFWEQSRDYSPYSPASRLFWNEFYLDPVRVVGFDTCDLAKALCDSFETEHRLKKLRMSRLVDYDLLVEWKSRLLRILSSHFFGQSLVQCQALDRFVETRPEVQSYARFRAAAERHGLEWNRWSALSQAGLVSESDYDPSTYRHHLFVQWQMHEQLQQVSRQAGEQDTLLYLDLPLGVSRTGYDTWLERDSFALGVNGGAPPDAFFAKGQNWCFPPLHPEGLRRKGYRYMISVLRHHFRYARLLRIDHAAGLHRLYWIPEGMAATQGAYVRYPADELYAILAIESHRAGAGIVGEDLGTVPRHIRRNLRRHGIQGMYVLPFEIEPGRDPAVCVPDILTLACLNTHDMAPFAAFWSGEDIGQRRSLDLLEASSQQDARRERAELRSILLNRLRQDDFLRGNESDLESALEACLRFLARSRAELLLVNLEDLWLETSPQNMPGTLAEYPNWRQKTALALESIRHDPRVLRLLRVVRQTRAARADR